jgi:hypothetical protein
MGGATSHEDTHIFGTLFTYVDMLNQFKTTSPENVRPRLDKLVSDEANKILLSNILNRQMFEVDGRAMTPLELIAYLYGKLMTAIQKAVLKKSEDEAFKTFAREYTEALNDSYLGAIYSVIKKYHKSAIQDRATVHRAAMNAIQTLVRDHAPVSAVRDAVENVIGLVPDVVDPSEIETSKMFMPPLD